ncbi:GGDEF domain-containing protein [Halodurantibacterium flavum]|uniref:diguanylate cyclase n=1 Tax=Halodurantibacterium flavum TaxID=1382802 RepID=A0ABW4S5V4_9RHOB
MLDVIIPFVNGMGLMALLTLLFGWLSRKGVPRWQFRLLMGAAFGLGGAASMLDPIRITDGVITDARALFAGLSGAFLGPLGATATLAITASVRIWIGGIGSIAGVAVLSIATAAGLVWHAFIPPDQRGSLRRLALLGLMISLSLCATLLLPADARAAVLRQTGLVTVGLYMIGSVVLGSMMAAARRQVRREEVLRAAAHKDPLTGLLNRRGLEHALNLLPPDQPRALLIVDVDHFKQINDSFGHPVGDIVLQGLSARIGELARRGDILARFGGEEFAMVLSPVTAAAAAEIAERLRRAIEARPFEAGQAALHVTVSIGGVFRSGEGDLTDAVRAADRALYAAKFEGRNRVRFSDSDARPAAGPLPGPQRQASG